jgi:hypothetical protein
MPVVLEVGSLPNPGGVALSSGWGVKLQIRPLRFASVGMTKGRVAFSSAAVAEGWREPHLACRVIIQVRPEPALDLFHGHPFASGVVFYLIAIDLAQAEIAGFWVGEVESAYA